MQNAILSITVRSVLAIPIATCAGIVQQATTIQAQSRTAAVTKWEVVSVKPCKSEPSGEQAAEPLDKSPNRIRLSCYSLHDLIQTAYVFFAGGHLTGNHAGSVPIEKLPGWTDSERYTVDAKAEGSPGQMVMRGPMLQALLESRFALKVRSEMHNELAYALMPGKSGLRVRPFVGSCTPENPLSPALTPDLERLKDTCPRDQQDWPMNLDAFAWWLGTITMRRIDAPVVNSTGINGYFRFNFKPFIALNAPKPGSYSLPYVDPDQFMESVRNALEDVGLRLVATKAPRRRLVIDHVERPTEN